MKSPDPFENQDIQHLQSFIYLIPVLGVFPALWTLYQRDGNREQRAASRFAVLLGMAWLIGYCLLGVGVQTSAQSPLSFLVVSSLLTSGYFLTNLWLMVQLWQRKSLHLPGIGTLSDRKRPPRRRF